MLTSLQITGYALIDSLDVEFGEGLNIITGETGAGKSILIGALKMILGGRASSDMIRTGARKAVIEGHFVVQENSSVRALLTEYANEDLDRLILRREIGSGGSRAFVNDYPVPVNVLKAIASEIIDLHGQHDQQSLLRRETHLALLDQYGRHQAKIDEYTTILGEVRRLQSELEELRKRESELRQREELHGFQLDEIDSVAPGAEEEEQLERERRVLENADKLRDAATTAYDELYGSSESIHDRLAAVQNLLVGAAHLDDKLAAFAKELASAGIAIDDAAQELSSYADDVESNEERLATVRQRLGDFEGLKRKYGGSIDAVLSYREKIEASLRETVNAEASIATAAAQLEAVRTRVSEAALGLSRLRKSTALVVEKKIVAELAGLGIASAQFSVEFEREVEAEGWVLDDSEVPAERLHAFADGIDRVEFLLSTNPGEPVRSLRRVASGGEVSRIMLALKQILAQRESLPILVFDEIDVGISGAIAQRVGERMSLLAARHQLITITHLPQIAACGDRHYVVEKVEDGTRTRTGIRSLSPDERAVQVAALISGAEVTEAGLTSARELLKAQRN